MENGTTRLANKSVKYYNQAKTKYSFWLQLTLQFSNFGQLYKHKTQSNLMYNISKKYPQPNTVEISQKMERIKPLIASSTSGHSSSPRKNM